MSWKDLKEEKSEQTDEMDQYLENELARLIKEMESGQVKVERNSFLEPAPFGLTVYAHNYAFEEMRIKAKQEYKRLKNKYKEKYDEEINNSIRQLIEQLKKPLEKIQLEVNHDIEYEKKLIDLLGYKLYGPILSNRWLILDINYDKMGYIHYEKINNVNQKNECNVQYGYNMVINSSDISYDSTRIINSDDDTSLDRDYLNYKFDIKRENGNIDHVEMRFGRYPSLTIWSKEYGYVSFFIDYEKMFLNFKSKTDNFNIEEVLIFKNSMETSEQSSKEYTYQISYCKKNMQLRDDNSKGRTTRVISGIQDNYDENKLKVSEMTFVGGKLRTDRENEVEGTIEEMAIKHQMGIDSFQHFRFLINEILPFKEDIISLMLNKEIINNYCLSMFLSNSKKNNIQKKLK